MCMYDFFLSCLELFLVTVWVKGCYGYLLLLNKQDRQFYSLVHTPVTGLAFLNFPHLSASLTILGMWPHCGSQLDIFHLMDIVLSRLQRQISTAPFQMLVVNEVQAEAAVRNKRVSCFCKLRNSHGATTLHF